MLIECNVIVCPLQSACQETGLSANMSLSVGAWAFHSIVTFLCSFDGSSIIGTIIEKEIAEKMSRVKSSVSSSQPSLLETQWQQDPKSQPKKGRCQQAINVQSQVTKAIYNNLADLTPEELDVLRCPDTGLTCRGRLLRDKQANSEMKGSVTFGSGYYRELRRIYLSEHRTENMLPSPPSGSEPRDGLLDGIVLALGHPPDRSGARHWMETHTTGVSLCEVVGISRWLLKLSPSSGHEQLHAARDILKWYFRIGLFENFKAVGVLMADSINRVLVLVP